MEWPEITINTPLSEVQAIHKRIWDYVIENGRKPDTPYKWDCVLCEYANLVRSTLIYKGKSLDLCKCCPYKNSNENSTLQMCLNGLYNLFISCDRNSERQLTYAKVIRDIPFKEEGYWKHYLPDSQ